MGSGIHKRLAAQQLRAACPGSSSLKPRLCFSCCLCKREAEMTNVIWAMQPPNVDSPSGEIKSFKQNLAFQTAFFIGGKKKITQTNSGKNMCIRTMSIHHQYPMASHDAIVPDRAVCLPLLNARYCKSSHQINYQGRKRGKEAEAV